MLAWGNIKASSSSKDVTIVHLNPATGTVNTALGINGISQFTLDASKQYTGVEFSPDNTKLFVGVMGVGIKWIDLITLIPDTLPLADSGPYGNSQLETAYDASGNYRIYAASSKTDLGYINLTNPNSPAFVPTFIISPSPFIVTPSSAYFTFVNPGFLLLPDQIDGENYDNQFINLTPECCALVSRYNANTFTAANAVPVIWTPGVLNNPFAEPSNTIKIHDELKIKSGTTVTIQNMIFEFGKNGNLIIEPGAKLILDNSTLKAVCDYLWDGAEVQPTAILQMDNSSTIDLNGNGKIFVDRSASGAGKLIYNQGSTIKLNDNNTLLEIKGDLQIGASAIFGFTGNGYIKFSSPPTSPVINPYQSNNIIAGANSQIVLTGSGPTDKVLEITQESMYAGSLSASGMNLFSITNGLVTLANNSRLNVGRALTLNNVKVTSISGSFNNHRGVHVYGQVGVSINNCTFEYGKYGIFKVPSGVASLTISNSIFRFCTTGLYSVGQGVSLIGCQFLSNNNVGWNASSMSMPSSAVNSTFINSVSGIVFKAVGPGSLLLKNSNVSSNGHSGIEFGGFSTLTVKCGSVANNGTLAHDFGILVHSGANLNMSSTMIPTGGTVSAINNRNTITSNGANTINLSFGGNNFNPAAGGKVLIGNLKNSPPCSNFLIATKNKWGATLAKPVQNVTYALTTTFPCSGQAITVQDLFPLNPPACLTPLLPSALNVNTANALDFCPGCPKIITASFNKVKYNDAVRQAMTNMEIENPAGNDLTAVNQFYEILVFGTDKKLNNKKQAEVVFLNDIAYTKMKEALGNAFLTGRTTDFSLSNPYVQQLLAVQDSIIAEAKANADDFVNFYTSTDKAFVHSLINQKEKTLQLLDNISTCVAPDSIQTAYLSETRKIALIEYLVLKGEVLQEDFEQLLFGNIASYSSASGINVAGDTASVPTQCVNQTVTFRPSAFGTSYLWNFGNGQTANTANASTTYTAVGTYTVTLVVTGECNANSTYNSEITIIDKPVASFNASVNSGPAPLQVDFTNTSIGSGIITYNWNFGDGNTDTIQNPSHTYQDAGTYIACLTVSNQCGQDTHCVIINLTASLVCEQVPNDVISWWSGEGSADDIADGNDGTLMNGATFGSGKVGQAFSLNGAGAFVNIPTAPNLNPSGSFTIEGWINSDLSAGAQTIALKWGDAGAQSNQRAYGLMALGSNGEMHFPISDDAHQWDGSFHTFVTPPGVIQTNTWHHVAAVYDQVTGTRYIYVNGQLIAQRTDPPITLTQSTTDLAIGAYIPDGNPSSASFSFKGMIDELSMYNRVLTQSELFAIYNAGSAGKCKDGYARIEKPTNDTKESIQLDTQPEISIYPNPNNGNMAIQYFIPQNEKSELVIYDLAGRKLNTYVLLGETNRLNISEKYWPEGIYFYEVVSNGQKIKQDKIVVIR